MNTISDRITRDEIILDGVLLLVNTINNDLLEEENNTILLSNLPAVKKMLGLMACNLETILDDIADLNNSHIITEIEKR